MKSEKSLVLPILWLGLLFAVSLFATSCNNFLKVGDVKKDIRDAIEIASSDPITIYVEAGEDSGTVTPEQLRLKKKETFELRYKPLSSWRFIKWEVRDRNTKEVVPDVIQFDDETALETKGRLLVPREGLEIYAKAVIMPEVVKVNPEPGSAISCYKSIVFTFNTPVDDSDARDTGSVFNYKNILITNNGKDVSSYFEKPYFNSDKTVLTIVPKAKDIYDYLNFNNMTVFDIRVTLSDKIVVTKGDQEVGLTQNSNTSFVLHYRPLIETNAPSQVSSLIVSRKQIKKENVAAFPESDKFIKITDPDDFSFAKVIQNRVANKIFIYGRYYDDESGINEVRIKEARAADNGGNNLSGITDVVRNPVKYTSDNALFIHDGKITEFFIEHEVKTEPGAVKLQVDVYDSCGNTASDYLYVFKVDSSCYESFNLGNRHTDSFLDENYNESIKTLVMPDVLQEYIYHNYYGHDKLNFNIYCLYNNKEASSETKFERIEESGQVKRWEYKLDVPTVSGLDFTILIVDDIGNTFQRTYSFPSDPAVEIRGRNDKKAYIYRQDKITRYVIIKKRIGETEPFAPEYFNIQNTSILEYPPKQGVKDVYLSNGLEYWIIPYNCYEDKILDIAYTFYGARPSSFKINTGNIEPLSDLVSLKTEPQINIVPGQGIADLYFTLADNTWTTFDAVYYEANAGSSKYLDVVKRGTLLVKRGIAGFCDDLYTNDITLKIYGIKDGKMSAALTKTIVTSVDSEGNPVEAGIYDITPPEVHEIRYSTNFWSFDINNGLNLSNQETNLDKLYIIESDGTEREYANIELTENESSKAVFIPVAELDAEADVGGVWRIKVTDKKQNATIVEYPKTIMADYSRIYSLTEEDNGIWTVSMSGDLIGVYLSTLNAGVWTETAIKERRGYSGEPSFTPSESVLGQFTIAADSFVKISSLAQYGSWEGCVSDYGYFYSNTSANSSGRYDYIQKKSDSEFWVTSDAPTLVHTFKTKVSYNECKDWTASDWEGHYAPLNDVVMNFSSTDHVTQRYMVPLDQINSDECYVVITYFAKSIDNRPRSLKPHMTEVMIKP